MTLPDPSVRGEQDWEEILPLENREDVETMKTLTPSHKAEGLPSNNTDWLQEKEGKPKILLKFSSVFSSKSSPFPSAQRKPRVRDAFSLLQPIFYSSSQDSSTVNPPGP
ncbi:Zinc finger protein 343 [Camelus dromedarius]|uniref:Zinc finger protein 343 n=1 Tax=Camelus dromedarius TaxID=9838 RepID=A0A5N4CUP7_CAMDR|nr:Zinc finger protein 343 [Camelus dromedarius]KAB1262571.1 Zinc finger protein 343 [Camelus dromedarius]